MATRTICFPISGYPYCREPVSYTHLRTVEKDWDFGEHPLIARLASDEERVWSLLRGATWWLPLAEMCIRDRLNTDAEPEELRDFLASLASYVLACDVTLQDGETIGFSADDKHTITRSPGVSLPEEHDPLFL